MSKYLVVGAGLFGAVFANEAAKRGHEVTVIEKRDHLAGNIYTKEVNGIQVHQYGAAAFPDTAYYCLSITICLGWPVIIIGVSSA